MSRARVENPGRKMRENRIKVSLWIRPSSSIIIPFSSPASVRNLDSLTLNDKLHEQVFENYENSKL